MDRDLLELINKINNRNIQKRRESGITVYIVLSLLAFLIYKLYLLIKNILLDNGSFDLVVIAIVLNVAFTISLPILGYLSILNTPLRTKIFPDSDFFTIHGFISSIILIAPPLAINLYAYFSVDTSIKEGRFVLLVFAAIYFLNLIIPILISVRNKRKDKKFNIGLSNLTYLNYDHRKAALIGTIMYFFLLGALITFFIRYNDSSFIFTENLDTDLQLGIVFILILFAQDLLFDLIKERNDHDDLEDLEAKIYLENIPNDEVRNILENEYFGISLTQWIYNKKKMIKDRLEEVANKVLILEPKLIEIEELDQKYFREAKVRFQEVDSELELIKADFKKYWISYDKQYEKITKWGALNRDEKNEIRELNIFAHSKLKEYSTKLPGFDARYDKIKNYVDQQSAERT